ncbi:MAG TPA: cation diffusion facilitator family transporter [Bryobacteraceae bacterium]|jgi:cation diffusion facilitator family transporter
MDKARKLAILGMVVSGLLAILKITVGWFAHSAALTADGFESATDVFTSGLVLVGLILAARPADQNHPYGHGRVEILIGLLLGFILACAGATIAWHGLTGSGDEKHVPASYAVWPLVLSILAKFGLVVVKSRHGRKIGSSSLVADAANDGIDMLSGLVALGALLLTLSNPTRFLRADHYGAFAVGLIVIATAARVVYESGMQLMDTMPDERSMDKIREAALSVHDVAGVEKCFARKTGLQYHVDLHLEVDPEITVRASHEIARRVRDTIRQRLPWVADVLVHVEPWLG